MKIPLPAKVRAFGKTISSVKRASSIDEENKLLEEENERLKIQREQLAKQLKAAEDLLIPINFIDEDGEVLQIRTTKNEGSNHLFDRYARKQGTPFLLGRVIYEFRFNGQLIPNVAIGSIGIDNNAIIYVTTKIPNMNDFKERIVPNIPIIVQDYPHCFINQHVAIRTEDDSPLGGVVTDYDEDAGVFTIEWADGTTYLYDLDDFAIFLQNSYSKSFGLRAGLPYDINLYLENLVERYEFQEEQLDTNLNQGLDKSIAIILRIIKIRQQIHRLLNYLYAFHQNELRRGIGGREDPYSHIADRLRKTLSSLEDKKKGYLSNTSIHKVNKPLLELDDIVRVKRWPNNDETLEYSWEKGTIRSYDEYDDIDGYGPHRVYSVEFDDEDIQTNIEDYHVIPDDNRSLFTIKESDRERIGINRVFDKDSSDQWAREIGWCTVEIDGIEESFVYMSDAIGAVNCKSAIEQDTKTNRVYEKQNELGLLQVIDRMSNPTMRHIGRLLIRQIDADDYDDQWEMENSGVLWKMALGYCVDENTKQMRDSLLRFAISRQCYGLDSSNEAINVDLKQLYNFFICSEGCLDTFLLKVPIFREGYDSTIPPEKDSLSGHQSDPKVMMTYLTNNEPEDSYRFVSVRFVCGNDTERYTVERDAPFKELLAKYAANRGTSIKSLRIKHNERTLFISSIGKKTPRELVIKDNDVLEITIVQSISTETSANEQPKQQSPKGKKNTKKKRHKKSKKKRVVQPLVIQKTEVELKVEHSKLLGKVYEEAEPTFKEIRQRLNAMNLERTKPKQRITPSKTTIPMKVVDNPLSNDQLGGKAGKTQFIIQVGEVSNLYKTTKPSSAGRGRRQDDIMIDLHGLTAEEAVYRLDKHLPDWIDTAMKGTYPFVIPVKIVCGGGSQILAEVVENWIKQNDNVANAPKNIYS